MTSNNRSPTLTLHHLPRRAYLPLLVVLTGTLYFLSRPASSHTQAVLVSSPLTRAWSQTRPTAGSPAVQGLEEESLLRQAGQQDVNAAHEQAEKWQWDSVKTVGGDQPSPDDEEAEEEDFQRASASSRLEQDDDEEEGILNDDDDTSLSYHDHLEKEHSPYSYHKHSSTLTFDHIYVLSLPHRTDRRKRMSKIAHALGLRFTFVDALRKETPVIGWIAERVKEIRDKKRPLLAKALKSAEDSIGGLAVGTQWLYRNGDHGLKLPDVRQFDQRWILPSSISTEEQEDEVVDWMTYLEQSEHRDTLSPSSARMSEFNISEYLDDPLELSAPHQVNDGVLSTWYSQTKVWKQIVENNDTSALILEDDTDIEFDFERLWPNIERALPEDWEVLFLGHCWGKELKKPQYIHPGMHRASEPRCLHGYLLSQAGARHLLEIVRDPWIAYQTPIDILIPSLTQKDKLQAFSMEPALIIQSKTLTSDIQKGVGSAWRGLLVDSTWDRILRDEGEDVPQLTWEDIKDDPAVKPRPWTQPKTVTVEKVATQTATATATSPALRPIQNGEEEEVSDESEQAEEEEQDVVEETEEAEEADVMERPMAISPEMADFLRKSKPNNPAIAAGVAAAAQAQPGKPRPAAAAAAAMGAGRGDQMRNVANKAMANMQNKKIAQAKAAEDKANAGPPRRKKVPLPAAVAAPILGRSAGQDFAQE